MSKRVFDDMKAGLEEAIAIAKGEAEPARVHFVPPSIDVRALRRGMGLTQTAFASRFGFPLATLRDWEQGKSRPDTSARAYLIVISRDPVAVQRALDAEQRVA